MYRACSTWQYNVVADLIEHHRHGERLGFGDLSLVPSPGASDRDRWYVLKAHDADVALASCIESGRAKAVYSRRDLRDVASSLAHKFHVSLDEVLAPDGLLQKCVANDAFWSRQQHVLCQKYETIVGSPTNAVRKIARHLGIRLWPFESRRVAGRYSLHKTRQHVEDVARKLTASGTDLSDQKFALAYDRHTLFHWDHLRQAAVGDWRREFTRQQALRLVAIAGDWLIAHRYAQDHSWVNECSLESTRHSRAA